MRWTRILMSVAASVMGLAAGAAIADETPGEGERDRARLHRVESAGYAASGPNFYVWEEDPLQGRRWAAELSRTPASKEPRVR